MPSVLWHCWLGGRKGIRSVKTECWGTGMVICLEQGANDLHVPSWCHCHPNISCCSKIQNGVPFWYRLTQVVLEKRPLNGLVVVIVDSDHFSIFQVLQVFWNQKYEKLRQHHMWKRKSWSFKITPFPSNRHHRSNGDCLESKKEN